MAAPLPSPLFAQRAIIGVGDLGASNNAEITLSTYALGSCVAVVAYDPERRVGGMLHFMLPDSRISPERAQSQPAVFADLGIPLLFRQLAGLRADLSRIQIFLAGGANVLCDSAMFRIGERNIQAVSSYLLRHNLPIRYAVLGGTINRTVHLNIGTGEVAVKSPRGTELFQLA